MKRLIIAVLTFIALCAPAIADDAKPAPKPTCGATVAECQKKLDDLNTQFIAAEQSAVNWQNAYNEAVRERDAAGQLSAFVSGLKNDR